MACLGKLANFIHSSTEHMKSHELKLGNVLQTCDRGGNGDVRLGTDENGKLLFVLNASGRVVFIHRVSLPRVEIK